ncbi:MAG: glycosyltransferase family 2 protein [Chloroflexi bacterium]|nr:glycosyltransferase family 2 protein [Chloroflexota bacterium]
MNEQTSNAKDSGVLDLSIIIVNYNTFDLTRQCIVSVIEADKGISREIILVDNASTDGSASLLGAMFPTIRLIANPQNVGFAAGNNRGIVCATGRYVLLLNSDTIVRAGVLAGSVEFLNQHPDAGAVGVTLVGIDGKAQVSYGQFHSRSSALADVFPCGRILPRSILARRAGQIPPATSEPMAVGYVSGAYFLVRRDVIDEIGLFDQGFFMYSEEMDWCWRMREKGWKTYLLPGLEIVHLGGGSYGKQSEPRTHHLIASRNHFLNRHYSRTYRLTFFIMLFAIVVVSAVVLGACDRLSFRQFPRLTRRATYYSSRLLLEWESLARPRFVEKAEARAKEG